MLCINGDRNLSSEILAPQKSGRTLPPVTLQSEVLYSRLRTSEVIGSKGFSTLHRFKNACCEKLIYSPILVRF